MRALIPVGPHAEDITTRPFGIPWAEKWRSDTSLWKSGHFQRQVAETVGKLPRSNLLPITHHNSGSESGELLNVHRTK